MKWLRSSYHWTNQSVWDLPSWIFWKRWFMIFTTITSSKSIDTRRCYLTMQIASRIKFKRITCMKTSMPISIYLIFLGTRKKVHSIMMKTKKQSVKRRMNWTGKLLKSLLVWGWKCVHWKQTNKKWRTQREWRRASSKRISANKST